jgi:cell division protein FtsI (penicillin-binding protein 3)
MARAFAISIAKGLHVAISPKRRVTRINLLCLLGVAWMLIVIWRLYSIQVLGVSEWQRSASNQHLTTLTRAAPRRSIVDRMGRPLSQSVPVLSLYARPILFKDAKIKDIKDSVLTQLAQILATDESDILEKLNTNKRFVWLARQVPRVVAQQLQGLIQQLDSRFIDKHPLGLEEEFRRYYPYKSAGSVLLGRVNLEGVGLTGVEYLFDKELRGEVYSAKAVIVDAPSIRQSTKQSFPLTVDAEITSIVYEELEEARLKENALGGMALMFDASSGEILTMVQTPTINLNAGKVLNSEVLQNKLVETVYEPGSVMKPMVAATAIEKKYISPSQLVDCEHRYWKFARYIIKDTHDNGIQSFHDVVVSSSNIGMAKVASRMGAQELHHSLSLFGFGAKTGLGLPGEQVGIFRPLSAWAEIDIATHSYGQGIAVTPIQMSRALASIVNGGKLVQLKLASSATKNLSKRVMSESTAQVVKEMLHDVVVAKKGTGSLASLNGVYVGGKTGTAEKVDGDTGTYKKDSYIVSFYGFAELNSSAKSKSNNARKLMLAVILDEPKAKPPRLRTGGMVAAPVFRRIMKRTLNYLVTLENRD